MRIQSVSSSSFTYNSQSSSTSSNAGNSSTATANNTIGSSNSYYDILDLSDIDLGDDNTLDAQDVERALQTEKSRGTRNIRASMRSLTAQSAKVTNKGFNSPFLKNSPDEFITKAAKLLAGYLNPKMSGGDDKVFAYAGTDFESAFGQFVKDMSTRYATDLAQFFSENGNTTDEEINKFVNELSGVIKEYGTQLAAGKDITIDDLTSKLHINGVGITIGELDKMVSTVNDINSPKMILDSHADFAVAGLGIAKMKAFTTNTFSEPVAAMLMKTYNQKVSDEIDKNDTEIEQSRKKAQKDTFIERYLNGDAPLIKKDSDKKSSEDPYYKLDTRFRGSAKEEIFKLFSNVNSTDLDQSNADYEKAVVQFQSIMKKWEHSRGYALHPNEIRSNSLKLSAAFGQLDDYIGSVWAKEELKT